MRDTYHLHRPGFPDEPRSVPGMGWVVWAYEHFIFPVRDEIDWDYIDGKFREAREIGGPLILDIEARPTDEALAKLVSHIKARRDQLFPGVQLWMYPLSWWDDPNCHTVMLEDPARFEAWRANRKIIGRLFGPLLDCYVPHFYMEHDWDQNRVLAQGQVFLTTLDWAMPGVPIRPAVWHLTNYNPSVPGSIRPLTAAQARACRYCAHKYANGAVFWNHSFHGTWAAFTADPAVRVYLGMPSADGTDGAAAVPAGFDPSRIKRAEPQLADVPGEVG